MELTLELVQALSRLVVEHKLDSLKLGELEIRKSKHEAAKLEVQSNNNPTSIEELDDILFHSTSAPPLSLEQLEALTITPIKKPKTKVKNDG